MSEYYNDREVYDTLCSMLNSINWRYDRFDDQMMITTGAVGEDMPMTFNIKVLPDKKCVILYSRLPITVPEDMLVNVAIGITAVNGTLVDGCFEINLSTGEIFFRATQVYRGIRVSPEMLRYMLLVSCETIDSFNDKFLELIKGEKNLNEFIEEVRK